MHTFISDRLRWSGQFCAVLAASFALAPTLVQAQEQVQKQVAKPLARVQSPSPAAGAVQQFSLPNGMTLIVKPDHRAPTAVHMVWVRAGAYDEEESASGAAHALEHMMFKGSKKLPPGEFSRRVAALGGQENAFTTMDYTGYYQQIPASRLADVMALEADRFANNQWPDEEFKRELAVIKEERRMRTEDNPQAQLYESASAVTFTASPYRRPVIGWMGDLDNMLPQDVRSFHQRWYVPANAAVVVVGDVDPQAVLALARKTYGAIPARAVPVRRSTSEPVQKGLRRLEVKAPAEQAYVSLAFKVPRLSSLADTPENNDALALTMLSAVLDGYSGARLQRALTQGPDRVADSAGSGNGLNGRGPQLFYLDGVPAAGKTAAQLEAGLRAEVARIAKDGVSEAELTRVKTQWAASQVYELDSLMNQARELGSAWIQHLPLNLSEQLIARLQHVTPQQVQAVALKYFGDEQLTVGTLIPLPRDASQPTRATMPAHGSGEMR